MSRDIFKEFDGYEAVVQEIAFSRKYSLPYSASVDSAQHYIDRLHPQRLVLRVSETIQETPSTKTLRLVSPDGHLPPFQAGQYIVLFVEVGSTRTSRPYSISSPPNQTGHYDITVRRVEGGLVSNFLLDQVKRGDTLECTGPTGHFFYNPLFHDPAMVLIAGGSGITPFMSMIREIAECGLDRTVHLVYGSRDLKDVIFHQALQDISRRFSNIRYTPVIEEPPVGYQGYRGLITGDLLKEVLGELSAKTYYLCGHQGMYDLCIPALEKLGVPRRKIRKEAFGAPLDVWEDPAWPRGVMREAVFDIRLNHRQRIKAVAGESLLVALEKAGVVVPSLCRAGQCSMCRVKLLSGKVFEPAGIPVRKSDRRFGYVHSCVSYPLADLEVLI
ncbi:MAG: FAD-binding oxidoreductase [Thermodesulfobacteriota bacterium]